MIWTAYRGYKVRTEYGDELVQRYQENSTLQRKYGRPPYPEDAPQEFLSGPATIDEKTKNSIRRRRQEMVAFAAQVRIRFASVIDPLLSLNYPLWRSMMSVQIYKLSQENHQVLRRCKGNVSANQVSAPPPNYVRPNGFKVMPAMLAQQLALQTPVCYLFHVILSCQ